MRKPYCIANQCEIPEWMGKQCEQKECQWLVFVCPNDLAIDTMR